MQHRLLQIALVFSVTLGLSESVSAESPSAEVREVQSSSTVALPALVQE